MGTVIPVAVESRATASSDSNADVDQGLAVSPGTEAVIERLAKEIGGTKVDVFSRALALFNLAVESKRQGKRLAIVDADDHVDTEITGF